MIFSEMIHEARIIPSTDSPHLPAPVRQWNGDPRGHWEHNTLVVDTTNFNGKGWISTSAAGGRIKGHSGERVAAFGGTLHPRGRGHARLRTTVDDPEVYTKPWKVADTF